MEAAEGNENARARNDQQRRFQQCPKIGGVAGVTTLSTLQGKQAVSWMRGAALQHTVAKVGDSESERVRKPCHPRKQGDSALVLNIPNFHKAFLYFKNRLSHNIFVLFVYVLSLSRRSFSMD